jgi:hypothetical protein
LITRRGIRTSPAELIEKEPGPCGQAFRLARSPPHSRSPMPATVMIESSLDALALQAGDFERRL